MGSTGLHAVTDTYGPILESSDDTQLDKLHFCYSLFGAYNIDPLHTMTNDWFAAQPRR